MSGERKHKTGIQNNIAQQVCTMLSNHAIKKLVHIAMQMFSGFKYSAIGIQNGRVDCLAYSIFYSPSRRCDSNWNTARSGSFHEASTIP